MIERLSAVVSGSFKFKPEIDTTISILEQTGVTVLEPTKGWLIIPDREIVERVRYSQMRPLPTEERLTTREIEDRFLRVLSRASFMYLLNQERYVGESTALELGFALAKSKPIYALEPLDYEGMEIDDWALQQELTDIVTVLPPESVAAHYIEMQQHP